MLFNVLQNASAAFRIRGPDANTFLSGQFTQEIRGPAGLVAYGLWLNQKGKTLADSYVVRLEGDEHRIYASDSDPTLIRTRLEDYLIADDVDLTDESDQWVGLQVIEAGDSLVRLTDGPLPSAGGWARVGNGFLFRAWGRSDDWFWLWVPRADLATWRERLAAHGREIGAGETTRCRILAGIPAVPADLGADDLPNEGGLDATAISYTKGCYLGQEVMARLKNLGQVRRRLHVVRGLGAAPAARTTLLQHDKRVGETRSAAPDGDGFVAFAMISLVNYDPAQPLTRADTGAAVEVVRHG
jgi:folate-binding protein YgfZ